MTSRRQFGIFLACRMNKSLCQLVSCSPDLMSFAGLVPPFVLGAACFDPAGDDYRCEMKHGHRMWVRCCQQCFESLRLKSAHNYLYSQHERVAVICCLRLGVPVFVAKHATDRSCYRSITSVLDAFIDTLRILFWSKQCDRSHRRVTPRNVCKRRAATNRDRWDTHSERRFNFFHHRIESKFVGDQAIHTRRSMQVYLKYDCLE